MAKRRISRRNILKGIGAVGAATALGGCSAIRTGARAIIPRPAKPSDYVEQIRRRVAETPLVDSHEHLLEEHERLQGPKGRVRADDWSILLSHYLNSDLLTAGMPQADLNRFLSNEIDPIDKWNLLEPWWPAVKNTGYGQAVAIAIRDLYDVGDLSKQTIPKVQQEYERLRAPGFYRKVLIDTARIDSCQVNCLSRPFMESAMPELLMQDISIVGMHMNPGNRQYAEPAAIEPKNLDDWHKVMGWWFEEYGRYAVAVKSQAAYSRDIDFHDVPAEDAARVFERVAGQKPVSGEDTKRLQDHLFWHAARKATENDLPVKLHTGYYAGQNGMPLDRLLNNPGSATMLCRHAIRHDPDMRFVFMHICYPYYEDLISVAKHYTNAYIDMCWAWIINPAASVEFLKHYIVTAPANKVLTFGGDYIPVEPVAGHAAIARRGIARALTELVDEGWLTTDEALDLVEPLMCGNARKIFDIEAKKRAVREAPWVG